MTKTILASGTTLVVGLLVGAATGTLLAKRQPREKEYVEAVREVPAVAVPEPVTPQEPEPEPPRKAWHPKPGEMCTIVIPDEMAIDSDTWKRIWIIPTDLAALADHMEYMRARDSGSMKLLRAHRAVWTDDRGMRDVKYLAEGAVPGAAKVRLGTGAYKYDSIGGMSKNLGSRASGVEAMISLFWLVKQD